MWYIFNHKRVEGLNVISLLNYYEYNIKVLFL